MSKRYPEIDTVNLTEADGEYYYVFPAHTKSIILQTRTGEPFRYAYRTGDIALERYITAHRGIAKMEDLMDREEVTVIYFSCSSAGEIMEVEFYR